MVMVVVSLREKPRPSYVAQPTKFFTSDAMVHVYEKPRNSSGLRASSLRVRLRDTRSTPAPCLHRFTRDLFVHVPPLILPPSLELYRAIFPEYPCFFSRFKRGYETAFTKAKFNTPMYLTRMNKIFEPSPSFLVTKSPLQLNSCDVISTLRIEPGTGQFELIKYRNLNSQNIRGCNIKSSVRET